MPKPSPAPIIVYWDSCVFIAWIAQSTCYGQEALDAMNEMERLVKKGDMIIVTSAITIAEVLATKMPANRRIDFPKLFGRKEYVLIDADRRVTVKAAEIRDHYVVCGDQHAPKTIGGADSIHLATAVREGCHAFYTFDGYDGKHVARRERKLIQLNNMAGNNPLTIVAPALNTIAQPVNSGLFQAAP